MTVDRLLAAALDLHAEDPGGFTMAALIARTGVSSGSLYHHFGSFDGLAAALYARCLAGLLAHFIHASAYAAFLPAHAEDIARAKRTAGRGRAPEWIWKRRPACFPSASGGRSAAGRGAVRRAGALPSPS
ncbi:hypothetical protein GCM10010156_73860 [Planobispora rosea]|uniref:HTH tetR-type domain-containing protein n=1 Tax=Planobispora rosea TaxID=35762 RepID=A0A8J3SFC8_PLARO|nr:hypothetical protein GCM10010156_73860 [Planobispora rosea]GIH88693.1 hypothetical protein Pro02_71010 [Planobispora rosea]